MSKARDLADFVSAGNTLADGVISVSEVDGAAPLASPTFTGTLTSATASLDGSVVINDSGADADFRVESDTYSHALFVDAGLGRVSVNISSPNSPLHVSGGVAMTGAWDRIIEVQDQYPVIVFNSFNTGFAGIGYDYSNIVSPLKFFTGATTSDVSGTGQVNFEVGINGGETVFNNQSRNDLDFRVESDNKTHMLFVDANKDAVQIGSNMAQSQGALDVGFSVDNDTTNVVTIMRGVSGLNTSGATSMGFPYLTIGSTEYSNTGSHYRGIGFGYWIPDNGYAASRPPAEIAYYDESTSGGTKGSLVFGTRDTTLGSDIPVERMRIHADGKVTINDTGTDSDFRVESDGNSHALFVDASTNRVGIGTSSPQNVLDVQGNMRIKDTAHPYLLLQDIGNSESYLGVSGFGAGLDNIYLAGYAAVGLGTYDFRIVGSSGNVSTRANLNVGGALSKGSGSFRIDHPLKPDTHQLVHSFIEGPQADLIYRGKVDLVAGQATVNIDTIAGMTEGTFVLLNRDVQCFTTNETGWTAVRGSISGNILTIEAQDNTCTDKVSWLVIGERQDQHMYDTDWTDDNGKVIVEPLKP